MRNYLHIGLGKAASTTLQAAVFDHVFGLDFVGKRGAQQTPRNKALGAITQLNSFQYDERRVLADLALDRTHPILISDEMCSTYSRIDPYIIACRMRSILGDAKVLLITREPEDWLNSLYFFRLERGHPDVFQDHNAWLRSNLRARQVGSPLLQVFYARIFQTYESVFGAGSVTLLPFEFLKREPQRFYRCVAQFLDRPADAIDAAVLKGKVFKKRFTADHFRMIRLLFDVEANRERIDRLAARHFRGKAEAMQYRSGPIDEYRRMMAHAILALRLDCEDSARVAFDEPLIRQIYAVNSAVDREIEQRHGIRLGNYGYRDAAGQPSAAPARLPTIDQQTSVRELYDALAPKYDQVVASSKYIGPDWLAQQLSGLAQPPKIVVDFACGSGHLGRLVRERFPDAHLSGVDISKQMVAQAATTGVYESVRTHDLHEPCPWIASGSVDLAIVLGFLEFLPDPSSFLAELARVLAPNGVALLSFQEHRPEAPGGSGSSGDLPATYTRDDVEAMLQAQPFEMRDIRSVVAYVTDDGREWHYLMANAVRLPNAAIDREIEQRHGIRLGDYGHRELSRGQPSAAPARAPTIDQQTSVRELYDALAPNYDQVVTSLNYVGPDWLERQLAGLAQPPKTVVDFACGNGHLGRLIRTRYPAVHLSGLDISDQMVAQAATTGVYDAVRAHDLHEPCPWIANGSIDLAIGLGFLEFLHDPPSFLAELARVLAPNGVMLLSFQEHQPEDASPVPRRFRSEGVLYSSYTREDVEAMVRALPFALLEVRSVTGYATSEGRECPYLMVNAARLPR